MEPVLLITPNGDVFARTPIAHCLFFSILIANILIPCLYSICFSRVFILRHYRPLMVLDLLISYAIIILTFHWVEGFIRLSQPTPILLGGLIIGTFSFFGLFPGFLTWAKGEAKLETYLAPITLLFLFLWFCRWSDYLPFSDFLALLWNKLAPLFP